MKSILTPRARPSLRWHWRLISHANSLTNRSARQTSKERLSVWGRLAGTASTRSDLHLPAAWARRRASRIASCEFGFGILDNPARYPSGPRERSAKPPFVGSNPTRASKSHGVRPGDMGDRSYRRHRLHFWAKRVVERLQSFFLQVDVAEIVVHNANQPNTFFD